MENKSRDRKQTFDPNKVVTLPQVAVEFVRLMYRTAKNPKGFKENYNYFHLNYYSHYWAHHSFPIEQEGEGFYFRRYRSEKDYWKHQALKLSTFSNSLERRFQKRLESFYSDRFGEIMPSERGKSILCLGARDGVEVAALRKHGLLAVGLDIAYPKNNPYVHFGDFHNVPYPDHCFDFVYMNVFDHVKEPEKVLKEIHRVLREKTGRFILDINPGSADQNSERPLMNAFESFGWKSLKDVEKLITKNGFTIDKIREPKGDEQAQYIFRVTN